MKAPLFSWYYECGNWSELLEIVDEHVQHSSQHPECYDHAHSNIETIVFNENIPSISNCHPAVFWNGVGALTKLLFQVFLDVDCPRAT